MKPSSIEDLREQLKQHPNVLGLVEFGTSHLASDYDLFVIVEEEPEEVGSLHFYISDTPVDLNVIGIRQLISLDHLNSFQRAILDGKVIHDSNRHIEHLLENLRQQASLPQELTEHQIARTRHGHRHVLDKVKGRLESMPVFSEFLLSTNIYWLILSYFSTRNIRYEGEKWAFTYLQQHEQKIYTLIAVFYDANLSEKYAITETLSEIILGPVGGLWNSDELIAFGRVEDVSDLANKGHTLFDELFSDNKMR